MAMKRTTMARRVDNSVVGAELFFETLTPDSAGRRITRVYRGRTFVVAAVHGTAVKKMDSAGVPYIQVTGHGPEGVPFSFRISEKGYWDNGQFMTAFLRCPGITKTTIMPRQSHALRRALRWFGETDKPQVDTFESSGGNDA